VKAERALQLLERLGLRAHGTLRLEELDRYLRQAHHMLVRRLSQTDRAEALRRARDALARFPDHAGLLADAVALSVATGAPQDAARLYRQLRVLSTPHANEIAEDLARGLQETAEHRLAGQRVQEGLDLLAEAISLFPRRADLHASSARALAAAGRAEAALAAAEIAARLDPSHLRQLSGYREDAERARNPRGSVEIPLDRATLTIRADVRVAGEPLELVVDTGATLTTIPSALVKRLGLWKPDLPTVRIETAGGIREAELVRIPEITIGSIRVAAVRAVVLDLPGQLAGKGLLGLNVLRRLNMRLDSERGRLILQERRARRH
jgi:clan AA aspartic protease (TIGR02281 family)